jgi:uncharacterized protein YjiS (DUF1127 family)
MSNRLLMTRAARSILPDAHVPWRVTIRAAWRRYRSRQRISELNSFMLKDIGVSYAEAEAEANKPFWRL